MTPDGDTVRFDYQESKFPGYSWKGFTFINVKQPAIVVTVDIPKSSNYQIMFKYSLNQFSPVAGEVKVFKSGELLETLQYC